MCSFDCLGLHSFLSFVKSSADSDVMAPLFDVVLDVDAKIKTIGKIYIERLATPICHPRVSLFTYLIVFFW